MPDIVLTHGFFLNEDPKEQEIMRPYPPLGLLYISGYLKAAGIKPQIFDSTFSDRSAFEGLLQTEDCGLLGIYTTHMTRSSVVAQIEAAKKEEFTVIVGGPDSAGYPEEYLDNGADVVVIGEGEAALAEIVPLVNTDQYCSDDLQGVAGLIYQDHYGKVVRTAPRDLLDINSIPWPDRESIDLDRYLEAWHTSHGETSINLIASRGCRYGCRWCSHSVFGNTERRRAVPDCADEVEWIKKRYNPDQLWYADDVFTMDHQWLFEFSAELQKRDLVIPFETISRADRMQDPEVVKELAVMGCRRIWIGSESGSDRILRAMGRGVTSEQIYRAVELSKQQGIETGIFLMWGYEGETLDDMALTVEHVKRCLPDIFFTTVVHPIKNTPYFKDIRTKLTFPETWAASTDKDYLVRGRKSGAFYKAADRWLKNSVKAVRLKEDDPAAAARCEEEAKEARKEVLVLWDE